MFIWENEAQTIKELKDYGYQIKVIPSDIKPGVPFNMVVDKENSTRDSIYHKLKYLTEENVLYFASSVIEPPYTSLEDYIYQNPTDDNLREFNKYYQLFNKYDCNDYLHYADDCNDIEHKITLKNQNDKKLKDINPALYEEVNDKFNIMTEMIRCGLVNKDTLINFENLTFTLGEYNQAAYAYSSLGVAGFRFIGSNRIEIDRNGDINLAGNQKEQHDDYMLSKKLGDMVDYCENRESDKPYDETYNIINYLNGNFDSEVLNEVQILSIISSGYKIKHNYTIQDKIKIVDYLEKNIMYSLPFIRMLTMNRCMIRSTEVPKYASFVNVASEYVFVWRMYLDNAYSEQRKLRGINF